MQLGNGAPRAPDGVEGAVAPALEPGDAADLVVRDIDSVVDLAIGGMIDDAYASAKDLLRSRLDDLKAGACLLLSRETITPNDFPPVLRRERTATFPKVPATPD